MKTILLSLIFLGSYSSFAATSSSALSPAYDGKKINLNFYKDKLAKDQVIEAMDSQDTGKPDYFIVSKVLDKDRKILQMHLFDLDHDGQIDLVKHFKDGKLIKTESLLDKKGDVFTINDYDPESGLLLQKTQKDLSMIKWKYFFKNELRREEADRNLDGKADMWVHYRNGKVLKTEVDEDYDGKHIKVIPGTFRQSPQKSIE